MNEFVKHITEVEGIRTPKRKRSKKEVEVAFDEFKKDRSAKKAKPKAAKAKKPAPAAESKKSEAVPSVAAGGIVRERVSENPGNIASAGYDPATKKMHVEFSKGGVYEFPNTKADEWDGFKATFADAAVDTGSYFRKAFRGRAASSRKVYDRGAAKAAPAPTAEVAAQ